MTRARDHLVMIGTIGSAETPYGKHSWLSSLRQAIPSSVTASGGSPCTVCTSWPDGSAEVVPSQTQPAVPAGQRRRDIAIDPAAVLAGLAPVPSSRVPEWKKATDLLAAEREWILEQPGRAEAGPLSPFVRGTIYHRCLEAFATTGSYDLAAITGEFPEIRALKPTDRARFLEDAEARLASLTGNEELAWIFRQQPGAHAELPFLFRRGNEIISGVIDRVVIREDTGYVIDYKSTITGSDEDLQSWIDHYRPQVRVYCEAVKELFRLESVEGYLLFLDSGRLVLTVKI
jgi:ATP-dependent exoDNAse (exonuclease V) beta subunit